MTRILFPTLLTIALALASRMVPGQPPVPPIYVSLWFDAEDYILPQDDDATKRLAEMLTRLGVRATFKVVGEKARVLEARGRRDVLAALARHDIGYHSDTHSQQPTIAVYLQHAGWDDGRAEFRRREAQGAKDIERIVGARPVAYGQPGSAWAPQAYPALRDMGIRLYLGEVDHVGLDDQPFYYGGLLSVTRLRSNLVRMDLTGGASLANAKADFTKSYQQLRKKGGGTISSYYHPNEWVHTDFWDGINFSRGANPPRADWKVPGVRPPAETEQAFRDFDQFIRFIKAQPGVRFVGPAELMKIYADASMTRSFQQADLVRLARAVQNEITFQRLDGYALSAADVFSLLTAATAAYVEKRAWPAAAKIGALDGPAGAYVQPAGARSPSSFAWSAFAGAVRDTAAYCRTTQRIPDEIWIGTESLSPADYLATLAGALDGIISSGKAPSTVTRRQGRYTAGRYVADDGPNLWRWPIFPEGFRAPRIMELGRLQAWTLKPAILQRP